MEKLNLHKQKIYSLIIAAIALIALLLPWISVKAYGFSKSWSGLSGRGWSLLSLLGVAAVAALCFIGDKTAAFDEKMKKAVLGAFGAIAVGALLFFLRKNQVAGGIPGINTGIGLWLCLVAGVLGVAFHLGFVKPPKALDDKVNKIN